MALAPSTTAAAVSRGRRGLSRLTSAGGEDFAAMTWGRAALLTRAEELPCDFDDLFSPEAVDELLSRRALRTPFIRMAKAGRTLPESAFTLGGGVGASIADQVSEDKVLRLFADGATIVLQGLHRTWAPVADLAQDLAEDLGHPVQVNSYTTPAGNQGFDDHYDVHDVFVLQVSGAKRWRVRPPVHELPLRSDTWEHRRDAIAEAVARPPLIDTLLRPGDCLYLPRGWVHSATATEEVSTHLTVGVHAWTRHHVLEAVLDSLREELGADPAVRAPLPLGIEIGEAGAIEPHALLVADLAKEALERLVPTTVTERLAARARAAQRAELLAPRSSRRG